MSLISKQLNLLTPSTAHAVIHGVPVSLIGTDTLTNKIIEQFGSIKSIQPPAKRERASTNSFGSLKLVSSDNDSSFHHGSSVNSIIEH
jgi:hypothetical protein